MKHIKIKNIGPPTSPKILPDKVILVLTGLPVGVTK
jgi:hypothetical protein